MPEKAGTEHGGQRIAVWGTRHPTPARRAGYSTDFEAHDPGRLAGRIDEWRSISSGAYGRRRLKRTRRRVTAITQPPTRLGGGTC